MVHNMKRTRWLSVFLVIFMACACSLRADGVKPGAASSSAKPKTPGIELAQTLTTITGVAISPLMGVGAVGAWKYAAAKTPQERANLPWFAQPWFWIPALVIVGICALKDTFGITVPATLKKPFDVLETMEHKVSGLVAAGAFVPLVASVFQSMGSAAPAGIAIASAGHGFLAAINGPWVLNLLSVPAMVVIFVIVCLASNAINILILLSPFPMVDAVLKAFRLSILAILTLGAFANPWVGAFLSLIIITIAWFIAGWSFRLSHLGVVFIWDTFTRRAGRFTPDPIANWMYLGRQMEKVPVRAYGKLYRNPEGALVFDYRPWLILPQRQLKLSGGVYVVGKGMFYSEILRVDGTQTRSAMLLPPRYRSHEQELSQIYGFTGVRDAGLRAAFAWLKQWIGVRTRREPQMIPV